MQILESLLQPSMAPPTSPGHRDCITITITTTIINLIIDQAWAMLNRTLSSRNTQLSRVTANYDLKIVATSDKLSTHYLMPTTTSHTSPKQTLYKVTFKIELNVQLESHVPTSLRCFNQYPKFYHEMLMRSAKNSKSFKYLSPSFQGNLL